MTEKVYSLVILAGHPRSGKTALAERFAASVSPPAKILSIRPLIERFLAELLGTEERNFREPRCNNKAYDIDVSQFAENSSTAPPESVTYADAYDEFYTLTRMSLTWQVWAAYLQTQIEKELKRADGARIFVIDDLLQTDEVEFLTHMKGARVVTIFLDGSPGKTRYNGKRPSHGFREEIRNFADGATGYYKINTDRQGTETVENLFKRCVRQIGVLLDTVDAQREAAFRALQTQSAKRE